MRIENKPSDKMKSARKNEEKSLNTLNNLWRQHASSSFQLHSPPAPLKVVACLVVLEIHFEKD
jgi:hypothetical protein